MRNYLLGINTSRKKLEIFRNVIQRIVIVKIVAITIKYSKYNKVHLGYNCLSSTTQTRKYLPTRKIIFYRTNPLN